MTTVPLPSYFDSIVMISIRNIILLLLLVASLGACRSRKPAVTETTRSSTAFYTSCYPIESITVPKCKLDITLGNKSYSLNSSIYIRPDSVCYFRGTILMEVVRGVIYKDSFVVLDRYHRICYKGSNEYLSRMIGYPVNPEILYMLFTGDRCEDIYREKFGFKVTAENNNKIVLRGQNRNFLEIEINSDNQTTGSITAYNRQQNQAGFKTSYSQYQQYQHFLLPTVFDILAKQDKSTVKINAVFQGIVFDQPQAINFSIPDGYKMITLR